MIPFLTMAQKRSKKNKKAKVEKVTETATTDILKDINAKVNFMIIKGIEVDMSQQMMKDRSDISKEESDDIILDRLITKYMKDMSKFYFSYDFGYGNDMTQEVKELTQASQGFRTMAEAVKNAAKYGWEFINSTIVVDEMITIHYYYMKRNR